jgi:hypothetical protein
MKPASAVRLLACALALATGLALAGEEEDFAAAKSQNTTVAWEAFLTLHPAGKYAAAARAAFDALLYRQAEAVRSDPQALSALFGRCKTPAGATKVYQMWDNAAWARASAQDSAAAYRDYLLRLPKGAHVADARARLEEATWIACKQGGTPAPCQQYLKQYPEGTHAQEAQAVLDEAEYQRARKLDTVEAYEAFLKDRGGHEAAEKRLRLLRYERAEKTNTLKDWLAFYDEYRYRGWADDGKEVVAMKARAQQAIEVLLYEKIVATPTLELCKDYLERYPDGAHAQQVIAKMEPAVYADALKENRSSVYLDYLERYPRGYRDAAIKQRLNALMFAAGRQPDLNDYHRYLRLCPEDKAELEARMEPLLFARAVKLNTIEDIETYLKDYPEGANSANARRLLEPLMFQKAQKEDFASSYREYIAKFPNGDGVQKARQRIEWLEAHKAVVEVDYPKEVEATNSPYWNVGSPFWPLKITFRETSVLAGYKLTQGTRYYHSRGKTWYSGGGHEITVKAGGSATYDTWWSSTDHELCNGTKEETWTGQDAGGHPLSVRIEVKGTHKNCPGPKK